MRTRCGTLCRWKWRILVACAALLAGQAVATSEPPVGGPTLGPCVGDCSSDGVVTVDELIKGVNIALGNAPVSECASFDVDASGAVTIDELIKAVSSALEGCITSTPTVSPTSPAAATATPTTEITPTATATPSSGPSVLLRAAGAIDTTTRVLLIVPDVVTSLLGHTIGLGDTVAGDTVAGGSAAAVPILTLPFTCDTGGGVVTCEQTGSGPATFTVESNNCVVKRGTEGQVTVNGTIILVTPAGGSCFGIPPDSTVTVPVLTFEARSATGSTITASTSTVAGSLKTLCAASVCSCPYDTANLELTGVLDVVAKDAAGTALTTTQVTFGTDDRVALALEQQNDQCVPAIYTMTVNGSMTFTTDGVSSPATFAGYVVRNDTQSGSSMVTVSGGIDAACGGPLQLATTTNLSLATGEPCPRGGAVEVHSGDATDVVHYTTTGGVDIDRGADGSTDDSVDSCLDPRLLQCPAG